MKRRDPPPAAPRTDAESETTAERARGLALFALGTPIQWVMTLIAALLLGFAGVWLSVAWHIGPETMWRKHVFAGYTAEARAVIRDSWLALDLDPAKIRRPDQWRAIARAVPCVVVEMQGDWSAARERAFCGTATGFPLAYDVAGLRALMPGVPFVWPRDARGIAVPELRVSDAAFAWLSTHPPNRFMHADWPATSSLDWLRLELDRPVDAFVAGWTSADRTLPVLYDPARPAEALPAGAVHARMAERPALVLALILGAIGVAVWLAGMSLLPAMGNFNRIGRAVLTVLPLLALPWWAQYLPQGLRAFSAPVAEIVGVMIGDIDPLDRLVASAPEDALLVHGTRIAWRIEDSHYVDTLGALDLTAPPAALPDDDAALLALADQVTAAVARLTPERQRAFFASLRRDKLMDLTAVGVVALPAARTAADGADVETGRAARAFLAAWDTSPRETADRNRLAFKARATLLETAHRASP
jgi:hypothetical protein